MLCWCWWGGSGVLDSGVGFVVSIVEVAFKGPVALLVLFLLPHYRQHLSILVVFSLLLSQFVYPLLYRLVLLVLGLQFIGIFGCVLCSAHLCCSFSNYFLPRATSCLALGPASDDDDDRTQKILESFPILKN